MPRIPIEDTFADVINKAQRGLKIADAKLCEMATVNAADLASVKAGRAIDTVIRRVARPLGLDPDALESLAHARWYPETPEFKRGFAMFNTAYGDMMVNSYLVWDPASREAAAFDTGATCGGMLDLAHAEKLRIGHIFLTHGHEDHVADLAKLASKTGAPVWASEREPADAPGAKSFKDGAQFQVGALSVKALLTWGHSPGQTTFFVTGLSRPLAIVGDSLFAGSIGGSPTHFAEQKRNDLEKIFTLPRDTVLACGHGPLTTLADEKLHNPFFASPHSP